MAARLDVEEWSALSDGGDFTKAKRSYHIGDSYTGVGNWLLLKYAK
jgi:hypothetical protein